jgi:hypothetical protein
MLVSHDLPPNDKCTPAETFRALDDFQNREGGQDGFRDQQSGKLLTAALSAKEGRLKKRNIGSSFYSWLREDSPYKGVTATAIKRVLARRVEAAVREKPNYS